LNFMLIPRWGIWGASISTVISSVALASAFYYYFSKLYPVKYKVHTVGAMLALAGAIVAIQGLVNVHTIALSILVKLALVAVFAVLLFVLRIFSFNELKRLIKTIKPPQ